MKVLIRNSLIMFFILCSVFSCIELRLKESTKFNKLLKSKDNINTNHEKKLNRKIKSSFLDKNRKHSDYYNSTCSFGEVVHRKLHRRNRIREKVS